METDLPPRELAHQLVAQAIAGVHSLAVHIQTSPMPVTADGIPLVPAQELRCMEQAKLRLEEAENWLMRAAHIHRASGGRQVLLDG